MTHSFDHAFEVERAIRTTVAVDKLQACMQTTACQVLRFEQLVRIYLFQSQRTGTAAQVSEY